MPDQPIIPFIEGDGTGPDIWRASVRVFDAAVEKAYGGKRKIAWMEVFAGEKAYKTVRHLAAGRDASTPVANTSSRIKGPLTTPVGGGIRSLNVALRQHARPLRLPAAGALVQGRAVARASSPKRWTW